MISSSQRPKISAGERRVAARLLRSWVRIPPEAWIFVCCECRVLSGRGLCDELITRPEESYRLWCVVVCYLETSRIGAPYIYIYIYIYDISNLRVKTCKVYFPHLSHQWTKSTQTHAPVIYSTKATQISVSLYGLFSGHGSLKRSLLKRDPISRWSFRSRNRAP